MQRRPASAMTGLPPVLALDLRGVSLAEGVRAGLAVAAVVALGQWAHWPGLMEAALGALLTCFADPGGPVRRRLPPLLAFAGLGTAITALFGLFTASSSWLVVPAATLCVFLTSFARSFGRPAMLVGNLLDRGAGAVLARAAAERRHGGDAGRHVPGRQPVGAAADPGDLAAAPVPAGAPRGGRGVPNARGPCGGHAKPARGRAGRRGALGPPRAPAPQAGARRHRAGARGGVADRARARPDRRPDGAKLGSAGSGRPDVLGADRPVRPARPRHPTPAPSPAPGGCCACSARSCSCCNAPWSPMRGRAAPGWTGRSPRSAW